MARKIKTFDYNDTFPRRLRKLVDERKDITQERIAELVGATRQTVGNWCSGKSAPDAVALTKIAREFNVSIDWLLQEDAPKQVNATLASVCKYTGLSESAVYTLHSYKNASEEPHTFYGIRYKASFNLIDPLNAPEVDEQDSKAILSYLSNAIAFDTLAVIWQKIFQANTIDKANIAALKAAIKCFEKGSSEEESLHEAMNKADKDHMEAELNRYKAKIALEEYFARLIEVSKEYDSVIKEAERISCTLNMKRKDDNGQHPKEND